MSHPRRRHRERGRGPLQGGGHQAEAGQGPAPAAGAQARGELLRCAVHAVVVPPPSLPGACWRTRGGFGRKRRLRFACPPAGWLGSPVGCMCKLFVHTLAGATLQPVPHVRRAMQCRAPACCVCCSSCRPCRTPLRRARAWPTRASSRRRRWRPWRTWSECCGPSLCYSPLSPLLLPAGVCIPMSVCPERLVCGWRPRPGGPCSEAELWREVGCCTAWSHAQWVSGHSLASKQQWRTSKPEVSTHRHTTPAVYSCPAPAPPPAPPRAAKRRAHPAAVSSSSSVEAAGGPPTPVRLGRRRPSGPGGGSHSMWVLALSAAAQPRQRVGAGRLEQPLLHPRGPAALLFIQRVAAARHTAGAGAVCTLLVCAQPSPALRSRCK